MSKNVTYRHKPDFEQFLKVLRREGSPEHLPLYEHVASPEFIAARMGVPFDQWDMDQPAYWQTYVEFWLGLGFDCVPMEIMLNCPLEGTWDDTSQGSEEHAVIYDMKDFQKYPWPDESRPIDFRHFETVASLLSDGTKIVGGVGMGPFEWVSQLMGVMGLSYALVDQPELVRAMFDKIGSLIVAADKQLVSMEAVGALRQGDDLGFKTSTFLSPGILRRHVFPIYKRMVAIAHEAGKPFVLHSCGQLAEVYDDLIEDVGIDAKHSFEEAILPVEEFKRQYGDRCTPLGGLDVDLICRSDEQEIRRYTRAKIEACFADGYYALGTGNSLTDYMPMQNYLIVLDEAAKVTT